MAKESMKAREVKRLKMVEKYAAKKEALKAAGDFTALQKIQTAQSLQTDGSPKRLYAYVWNFKNQFQTNGSEW